MAVMDFLNLGAARNNAVASILTFPPLDTDGIARRMRLREKAKENGPRDMPPATSQSLDAVANFRNRTHNGANELYLLRKDVIDRAGP